MHGSWELTPAIQNGLAAWYFLCALLNAGFAYYWFRHKAMAQAALWGAVTALFLVLTAGYLGHAGWTMPQGLRNLIDFVANPITYFVGSLAAFVAFLKWRKFSTEPSVAWAALNLLLLFGGFSMTDPSFQPILLKPDNVPIPLLIFSVGYFTWFAMRRAVINDERLARG